MSKQNDNPESNPSSEPKKELFINDKDDFSQDHQYLKMRKEALVDLTEDFPAPVPCLTIEQDGSVFNLGAMGEFSLVIGKAKSRKTFFAMLITAETLPRLPEGKDHVLFFDTEQSGHRVHKFGHRILSMCKEDVSQQFQLFRLRKFSPKERLKFIEQELANEINGNVGLVVIDGVRDLVTSINDENQSTDISSRIMKWSEKYSVHILVVLHQNKGDNNARGHLGSELVNKAESVISVAIEESDRRLSVINCEYSRDEPFEQFLIGIDANGLPYHAVDDREPAVKKSKIPSPEDVDAETHKKVVLSVFNEGSFGYGETVKGAKEALEQHGFKMGDNKTKEFITYWLEKEYIKKEGLFYSVR